MTIAPKMPRSRAERGDAKRQAILSTAVDLFLEVGYGAASINLLVDRVGGSKSTVYAHFQNKEKLFEAMVKKVVGEVTGSMRDLELAGLDLRTGLMRLGTRLFDLVQSRRHVELARLVIAEASRFPEVGRIYYRHGPGLAYKGLARFLRDHAEAGHIDIDDTAQASDYFAATLLHRWLFKRFCVAPDPPDAEETAAVVTATVDHFIRAYAGRQLYGQGEEGGRQCD